MAVFNPNTPNLSPNYSGITDQLQQRANLELKRPSPLDVGTQIVQRFDQEFTKQRDFEKKMAGEGRSLFTEEGAHQLAQELGVPVESFRGGINRYFSPKEAEELISSAMGIEGMKRIKESVGKPNGITETQYNALLASEEQGKAALATYAFPKSINASGRRTVRLEDPEGKIHEVPNEIVGSVTDWDTFDWSKYPLAGYKATTTKDPATGEVINVTGSGKVNGITGPAPKPKGSPVRTDYSQLNVKERDRVDKASKEVLDDPVIKDIRETNSKLGSLKALINENLPQGIGVVQSRVARFLASEKGALAEGDVGRASGSPAYDNQIQFYINKARGGGLTDADVAGFLQLLDTVESTSNNVLSQSLDQHIYRLQKKGMSDVNPEVLRGAIGVTAPTGTEAKIVGRRKANQ